MPVNYKLHRVSFENLKLPSLVYKYRCWKGFEKHRRMLTHREIFLPSPDKFNDPFDCKIPIAYHLLETDLELRARYWPIMFNRLAPHLNFNQRQDEIFRLERRAVYSDFRSSMNHDEWSFQRFNMNWGVFSMSSTPYNTQMWAHYSNNHKGLCLGFDPKILFVDPNKIGGGGKVHYQKKFPIIMPDEDPNIQSLLQIYTKAFEWQYEKEYRVDKIEGANSKFKYMPNALKEIYFGYLMPSSERNDAFLAARSINKKVKAFVVFPEAHSFNMNSEIYNPSE